jgi:hypothetical protein
MLDDMRHVKESVEDEFLEYDGVVGVDIGYKEVRGHPTDILAIRVLVREKKDDVPDEQRIPETIEGFRTDVIERGIPSFLQDTAKYDPLVGGISGGTCGGVLGVGTLGAVVRDLATGELGLLSNWHVLVAGVSAPTGLQVAQPGPGDGGRCPQDVIGQVTKSAINEWVDCAVAKVGLARPVLNAIQDTGTLTPPATMGATIGWPVTKRGRTTGLTFGTVDTVDGTIELWDAGVRRIFKQQIGIWRHKERNWAFAQPGDSGSVVVDRANNKIVGLLFAASDPPFRVPGAYGWANPIAKVLYSLGVAIYAPKPKEKDKEKEKEEEKEIEKDWDKLSPKEEENNLSAEVLLGRRRHPRSGIPSASHYHEEGPLYERLARLEASVDELRHFIVGRDRPDVGTRAAEDEEADGSSPSESEGEGTS